MKSNDCDLHRRRATRTALALLAAALFLPAFSRADVLVPTTINGANRSLAWQSTLGKWEGRNDDLVPVDVEQINRYCRETAKIFFPREIKRDFEFSCEFFMADNTTGAGGPLVYFRAQPDGSSYAFRYVNYWGTAVLQRRTPGQPWVNIRYVTNLQLAVGQWHTFQLRCRGTEYSVLINGKTVLIKSDASLIGGVLGLGCQYRQVQFRRLRIGGKVTAIPQWSMTPERPPYTVVCADAGRGGYQAFPGLCRLKQGDLLAVFYAGWGHVSRPDNSPNHTTGGAVALSRSTDNGKTWGPAKIVMDTPFDDRDPAVWECDDGTVVVSAISVDWPLCKPPYEGWVHTYLVRSTDQGRTWTKPEELAITDKYNYMAWTEPRRLANGDWLWPVYLNQVAKVTTAMMRSTDGGHTWGKPVAVDEASDSTDEPDLCQFPDGTLFCAMRPVREPYMWQSWSHDNGHTWTRVKPLPFYGHCANLLHTRSGITLLACRDAGTCIRYSLDQAKTWVGDVMIDSAGGAYSQMLELPDGRVVIVYYTEGAESQIRAQLLDVTPSGISVVSP